MSQSSNTKENKKHIKQTYAWLKKLIDGTPCVYKEGQLEVDLELPALNDKGLPSVAPEYAVQTSVGSVTWLPRDDVSMVMRLSLFHSSVVGRQPMNHFIAIPVYIKSHWRERHRVDSVKCASHLRHFWEEDAKACQVHGERALDKVQQFVPGAKAAYAPGQFGELLQDMGRACFPFVAPFCIHSAATEQDVVEGLHRQRPYYETEKGSLSAPGAVAAHLMIDDYAPFRSVIQHLGSQLCARRQWFFEAARRPLDLVPEIDERQAAFTRRMQRAGV